MAVISITNQSKKQRLSSNNQLTAVDEQISNLKVAARTHKFTLNNSGYLL